MIRLLFAVAALLAAAPALAQSHAGHAMPAPPAPAQTGAPACTPEHAAMGHCTLPETPKATPADADCPPEHAAMGHCTPSAPAKAPITDPNCPPEHAAMGHCTPSVPPKPPADDPACPPEHAAMGHCTPSTPAPATPSTDGVDRGAGTGQAAGAAPAPVPANRADSVWGAGAMAPVRRAMHAEHGGGSFNRIMVDIAELTFAKDHDGYRWEADAWFGGDLNRLALKTEGEGAFGEGLEDGHVTALYSRAIDPYFNLQAGLRQDFGAGPSRTHLVAGIEGLAPYWFEVDGYLILSDKGELRAELSGEYDQRLTQKLILQPRLELGLSAQDIPALGIGAGLTGGEAGLRLRYEFVREFAPYVGVSHEVKFGRTADMARAASEAAARTVFVAGVRWWF